MSAAVTCRSQASDTKPGGTDQRHQRDICHGGHLAGGWVDMLNVCNRAQRGWPSHDKVHSQREGSPAQPTPAHARSPLAIPRHFHMQHCHRRRSSQKPTKYGAQDSQVSL
ncbi:hypothetical protein Cob_v010303 [Colletotrichum orbiculare MAFF 240422]|uniref:Uncharacterized protein n=1 Tax=Colletotrichum orbiculare (strain 104-T / ATCC 96160 / CBS 514.97 / LARS 414 / MAFF 240422) TaxID=1213857 RepID=A0A484FFD3_COLOR|nr:hypothetical protein Cob_v010303 [Colletotrichum orbiculare MAFF 240422]